MITPIAPSLFGPPLPAGHPWASSSVTRRSGWGTGGGTRAHLLRDEGGCTLCRRGVPRCVGLRMRIAADFHRTTCARCIKSAMFAADPAGVRSVLAEGRGLSRELSETKLARAIVWWRMCGAVAGAPPYWLIRFFLVDVDVNAPSVSP